MDVHPHTFIVSVADVSAGNGVPVPSVCDASYDSTRRRRLTERGSASLPMNDESSFPVLVVSAAEEFAFREFHELLVKLDCVDDMPESTTIVVDAGVDLDKSTTESLCA